MPIKGQRQPKEYTVNLNVLITLNRKPSFRRRRDLVERVASLLDVQHLYAASDFEHHYVTDVTGRTVAEGIAASIREKLAKAAEEDRPKKKLKDIGPNDTVTMTLKGVVRTRRWKAPKVVTCHIDTEPGRKRTPREIAGLPDNT